MVLSVLSAPSFCNPAGCSYAFVIHQYDSERMLFALRIRVSHAMSRARKADNDDCFTPMTLFTIQHWCLCPDWKAVVAVCFSRPTPGV